MAATCTLADRLEPIQAALAELEREYRQKANADNEPDDWRTWSDLNGALMAVRSSQGRAGSRAR